MKIQICPGFFKLHITKCTATSNLEYRNSFIIYLVSLLTWYSKMAVGEKIQMVFFIGSVTMPSMWPCWRKERKHKWNAPRLTGILLGIQILSYALIFIIIWFSLFSGHGERWLVAVREQYAFFQTGKFWRENFWVDLNKNKKGLGMFYGKVRTITRPGTVLLFLKAVSV